MLYLNANYLQILRLPFALKLYADHLALIIHKKKQHLKQQVSNYE